MTDHYIANYNTDGTKFVVTKYNTDGTKEIKITADYPSTRALKKLVGGYLQLYCTYEDDEESVDDIYIDEEGKLKGLKQNKIYQGVVGAVVRVQKVRTQS